MYYADVKSLCRGFIFPHALFRQARLALGLRHEVVCDVARRLSEFAIQKKNYDRVRFMRAIFFVIIFCDACFPFNRLIRSWRLFSQSFHLTGLVQAFEILFPLESTWNDVLADTSEVKGSLRMNLGLCYLERNEMQRALDLLSAAVSSFASALPPCPKLQREAEALTLHAQQQIDKKWLAGYTLL
jgi:hypothetical protein